MSITKGLAVFVMGASLLMGVSGCQTGAGGCCGSPQEAVTCDRCHAVWVRRVDRSIWSKGTAGPIALRSEKGGMACPDCEMAAEGFFKGGKLAHHCKRCGGTLAHCKEHRP